MLNHDPKKRPTAVETRLKYKQLLETMKNNSDKNFQFKKMIDQMKEIGNNASKGRNRFIRQRKIFRHRFVK